VEDCGKNASLGNGAGLVLLSEKESTKAVVKRDLVDHSTVYCDPAGHGFKNVQQTDQFTPNQMGKQAFESCTTSSSLHTKLDKVDALLGAIRNSLLDLLGFNAT
jgi:hypothetical protein